MEDQRYTFDQTNALNNDGYQWDDQNGQSQNQPIKQQQFPNGPLPKQSFSGQAFNKHFELHGNYQPAGPGTTYHDGSQGFVTSRGHANLSIAEGVVPQYVQPVVPSHTPYQVQNQFLGGYDPHMIPQFGEVTRRAFTRFTVDGTEEYEASMPREKGNTIPDPISVQEGGRTYQSYREGQYFLPNDAVEQDRLDMNHVPLTLILNGALHLAPVERPARVLDIGTGTGIWAIDFAERNPNSEVIGTDLSMIQPPVWLRLPNVKFFRDDVEDDWIFDEPFDFIHQRLMFSSLNDHRALAKKMFDNLKPGGWVEYQDTTLLIDSDDRSHRGTALHQWTWLAMAGAAAKGRDFDVTRKYKDYLTEAGFVDITEKRMKLWGSGWPADKTQKKIGQFIAMSTIETCQAISTKLLQDGLSWSVNDVEGLTRRAQEDIKNKDIHFWFPFTVVYGRKPFPNESARG